MRLTRVLFKKKHKGAGTGQLRTPKNYQNPEKIQGVLTHTKGVELIPKVPKVTFGGGLESIHQGFYFLKVHLYQYINFQQNRQETSIFINLRFCNHFMEKWR